MRFKSSFGYLSALLIVTSYTFAPLSLANSDKNQSQSRPSVEKHFNQKGQYTGKSVTIKNETKHYDSKGKYIGKSKSSGKKTEHYDSKGTKTGTSVKRK